MDEDFSWNSDDDSSDDNDLRGLEVTQSPQQEDLLPLLECPVCFDLPLPPVKKFTLERTSLSCDCTVKESERILTCYQGHIICAVCCPKLVSKKCPLCQKPIGYGRNFFAEDYINKSTMKCKYKTDGCNFVFTGAEAKAHIPQCDFRPLKCIHCAKRVAFSKFEDHLWTTHQISQWDISEDGRKLYDVEKQRNVNQGIPQLSPAITSSMVSNLLIIFALSGFLFFTDHVVPYVYEYYYN